MMSAGDAREDNAAATAVVLGALFARIELALIAIIAALAKKTAAGTMTPAAGARRLSQAVAYAYAAATPRVQATVDQAAEDTAASVRAVVAADLGPQAAAQVTMPDLSPVVTAISAATANASDAAADAYQAAVAEAIAETRGGAPFSTLSLSRIQAAQKALDTLAEQGITGFTDRAGRQWDLASYVEMATRTAVSNAWDDLQARAMTRSGLDLGVIGTHSLEGTCPACLPWLGRTVSLTGHTAGYPAVAEAKAAGWRHPQCRCFLAGLGTGEMGDVTNPLTGQQAAAAYEASQRQRALERRVRLAGRRAQAAITPQARSRARRELAAARALSAAHRERAGVVMTKVGVMRRERPFGPR